jgi:hypothetical protein
MSLLTLSDPQNAALGATTSLTLTIQETRSFIYRPLVLGRRARGHDCKQRENVDRKGLVWINSVCYFYAFTLCWAKVWKRSSARRRA